MRKLILILLFVTTLLNAQFLELMQSSGDIKPDQFTFTDVTGANLSTVYSAYTIVSGINKPTAVNANGASYKVGANGSIITIASTCVNGDTVYVYNTSSSSGLTATNVVLTVGTISDTYTVTTGQGFIAAVNTTNNPSIVVQGTGSLYVDWGDGSNNTYTLTSSNQTISHTYSSAINTSIKLNGNLTKFSTSSNMAWFFNLSSLPSSLTTFSFSCSNTITGNLSSLPSSLTTFICAGSNTVTGNLSSLPSSLTYFYCAGSNTIYDYTSPKTWNNNVNYINLTGANTLSSTEVDNLIIDLANATWAGSGKTLYIKGNSQARTSASDTAVTTLQGKGVTVTTN